MDKKTNGAESEGHLGVVKEKRRAWKNSPRSHRVAGWLLSQRKAKLEQTAVVI